MGTSHRSDRTNLPHPVRSQFVLIYDTKARVGEAHRLSA